MGSEKTPPTRSPHPFGAVDKAVVLKGALGDIDPLHKVPFKRAISMGPL